MGKLGYSHPLKLAKIFVGAPCADCDVMKLCGGRCLYANITKRWNENDYDAVCHTVKQLVKAVESELPRIKGLIKDGRLLSSDFQFIKYNGCEIIP